MSVLISDNAVHFYIFLGGLFMVLGPILIAAKQHKDHKLHGHTLILYFFIIIFGFGLLLASGE